MSVDPELERLREQISATDSTVLAAVNERLRLVAEIKAYKEAHGIDFLDPERERRMLEELSAANGGPLSDEGVRELQQILLDLTKRELA
jgi:3-deoxy-7-phosphoheptulonate synthase/chorismate mutase